MGIAYFDGDQISHDSYLVLSGTSEPRIITYPRTVGGILQESGIVNKKLMLKSYLIPPSGSTREQLESYIHNLNEQIGSKDANLYVNGNTYVNCSVESIDYVDKIVNNYLNFDINFILGQQNTSDDPTQFSVPELVGFSRGRIATFKSMLADGSYKTFTFWHNVDLIKNFATTLTIRRGSDVNGVDTGKVIRVGGFERIICKCWLIGPDLHTRKNIEAYFFNIINGPLGRLGTFTLQNTVIENAFLTEVNMEDSTNIGINYTLVFIASLQC